MEGYKGSLSPQATLIYKTLLNNGEMTAREIGGKLDIFPNAVYRATDVLIELGCVKKLGGRPVYFSAKPVSEAIDSFLMVNRHWFLATFSSSKANKKKRKKFVEEPIDISFVQNRSELIEKATKDQKTARDELCLIVSGDEVPAETVLENKRAIDRGVNIRILAQRADKDNIGILNNWQRMGIKVRYSPLVNLRIIIIDLRIVYITNYNPGDKKESSGVRFEYQPISQIMKELFNQKWKVAKRL